MNNNNNSINGDWGLGPIPNPQSQKSNKINYFLNFILIINY